MLVRFSPPPWLLTLVCVALLCARMGGAHLHLCFDGGEPAASLHVTDSERYSDHHYGETHDDRDVSLLGEAMTKSGKSGQDLPLLLATFWLAVFLFTLPRMVPAESPQVAVSSPRFFRPLLRGPPLHAS